jgi:hypothetical protein
MTEGYILNAVQTATPLSVVYRSVQRGNGTVAEIEDDTCLSEKQISDALSGLRLVRLVEKVDRYCAVDLPVSDRFDDRREFQLSILHNLALEACPASDDWGKQSAIIVNFEHLIESNTQFFNRTDQAVADDMDTFQRELNYHPDDGQGDRNDMNSDKLTNWTRTADLLGLVRQVQGTDYATAPDPWLLHSTMRLATEELSDPSPDNSEHPCIEIQEYFEWMRENFLRISLTDDGEVPEVLARSFEFLSRSDAIRLVEAGDAGAVGLSNVPTPRTMDSAANSIEVR